MPTCQIVRNNNGLEVKAENGKKSKLFSAALSMVGNESDALNLWATAYTDKYQSLTDNTDFDSNGEPKIEDVLKYLELIQDADNLTGRDVIDINKMMQASNVSTFEEFSNKLNKIFPSGVFDLSLLIASDIFTRAEKNFIENSSSAKANLIKLNRKIQKSDHDIPIEEDYDEQFKVLSGEFNKYGKNLLVRPEGIVNNILEETVGTRNREEFDQNMQNIAYQDVLDAYNSDKDFADSVFERFSGKDRIPVQTIDEDGNITIKNDIDKVETMENTLDLSDLKVFDYVETLKSISEDVWKENQNLVKKGLKEIKEEAIENGLDLEGIENYSFDRDGIIALFNSLEELAIEQNETNLKNFSNEYRKLFGIESNQSTRILDKMNGFNVVITNPSTNLEMFSKYNMLQVKEGIYKIVAPRTAEYMYNNLYNRTVNEDMRADRVKESLPNVAYKRLDGKGNVYFTEESSPDENNKDIKVGNILDLTGLPSKSTSYENIIDTLENNNVKLTDEEKIKVRDRGFDGDPLFVIINTSPEIIESLKRAGYDSIKQNDSNTVDTQNWFNKPNEDYFVLTPQDEIINNKNIKEDSLKFKMSAEDKKQNIQSSTMLNSLQITEEIINKLEKSGLSDNVYRMNTNELEEKLKELGVDSNVSKQVVAWHGTALDIQNNKISIDASLNFGELMSGSYFGSLDTALAFSGVDPFTENISELSKVFKVSINDSTFPVVDMKGETPGKDTSIKDVIGEDYYNKLLKGKKNGSIKGIILKNAPEKVMNETPNPTQYLVFDDNVVKNINIYVGNQLNKLKKTLFSKDINLIPNGFVVEENGNNNVYLNTDNINPNTPIHEFGHLYLNTLKGSNPDLYEAGLNLIDTNVEEAKTYIDYVNKTQPNLKEGSEEWKNEILAQIIGDRGENLLKNSQKDTIKDWLNNFWNTLKNILGLSELTAEEVRNMTLSDFGDAVVSDLMKGERSIESIKYKTLNKRTRFKKYVLKARENAIEYYKRISNKPFVPTKPIYKIIPDISNKISEDYNKSNKNDIKIEEVNKSYEALVKETIDQYKFIVEKGLKVVRHEGKGEPYENSRAMLEDIRNNNRLIFLPNSVAFGEGGTDINNNIGLKDSGIRLDDGYIMTNSEVFRVVHDYFGHGVLGNGFGAIGEENATLQHLSIYSEEALPAVVFQTRGQNSWVNFSGVNSRAKSLFKEAAKERRNKNFKKAKELSKKGVSLFKFAEPKIGILENKYNFKYYESARRLQEEEKAERYFPRRKYENNELSYLLEEYTIRSRSKRGVNRKDGREVGVVQLHGVDVTPVAEYTLSNEINKNIKEAFPMFKGTQKIYEITDGSLYRKIMVEALEKNPYKASVTVHSPKEFSNMRLFITEDGSTGITLTKDGFLGGAFSDSKARRPNNLSQLMLLGIKEGALTAESFDTVLPDMYAKYGFKAVSKTAFNDDFKPMKSNGALSDWDYNLYKNYNSGRPDIVFLIFDGGDRDTISKRFGQFDGYGSYQKKLTKHFDKDSYDDAYSYMETSSIQLLEYRERVNEKIPKIQFNINSNDLPNNVVKITSPLKTNVSYRSIPEDAMPKDLSDKSKALSKFKDYVSKNIVKLSESSDVFDYSSAENMILQKYSNYLPIEIRNRDVSNKYSKKVQKFDGDYEYLSSNYITSFQKEYLKERDKNSQKFKEIYSKFEIGDFGIVLKDSYISSIKDIEESMTELFNDKELEDFKNYTSVSKDSVIQDMFYEEQGGNIFPTFKNTDRIFFQNNIEKLSPFSKNYSVINEGLVVSDQANTNFIRIDDELYEQVQSLGGRGFYRKIPNYSSNFNVIEEHLELEPIDLNTMKEVSIKVTQEERDNNIYTKSELKEINEDNFDCQ